MCFFFWKNPAEFVGALGGEVSSMWVALMIRPDAWVFPNSCSSFDGKFHDRFGSIVPLHPQIKVSHGPNGSNSTEPWWLLWCELDPDEGCLGV